MEDLVRSAAALHVPGYNDLAEGDSLVSLAVQDSKLHVLAGGMSNAMYRLERVSQQTSVIARVVAQELPPGSCDLDQDLLMRSIAPLAPISYGKLTTRHGLVRFEQFVPGSTMNIQEFREEEYASRMGHVIGCVHSKSSMVLNMLATRAGAGRLTAADLALQDQDMLVTRLLTYTGALARAGCTPPDLSVNWARESAWLKALMSYEVQRCGNAGVALPDLASPQSTRPLFPGVVLVHGDGQTGNWLLSGHPPSGLTLIDWEYACFAPFAAGVGFDLGNAMCEFAFDYSAHGEHGFSWAGQDDYPSIAWQRAYMTAWAQSMGLPVVKAAACECSTEARRRDVEDRQARERTTLDPQELDRLFPDPVLRDAATWARLGILNSHLFWAMWSFLMASGRKDKALARAIAAHARMSSGSGSASGMSAVSPMSSPGATDSGDGLRQTESLPESGHSSFQYEAYGRIRWAEYKRLAAQLREDAPLLAEKGASLPYPSNE